MRMCCILYYRHHNPFFHITPFLKNQSENVAMNEYFFKRKKATFAQMTKNSFMKRTYGCLHFQGSMPVIRSFKCVYIRIQTLHISVRATEHQAQRTLWTLPLQNENVNRGWLKAGWAWNRLSVRERKGFNQWLVQSAAKFTVWVPPWAAWLTHIDFKSDSCLKLLF